MAFAELRMTYGFSCHFYLVINQKSFREGKKERKKERKKETKKLREKANLISKDYIIQNKVKQSKNKGKVTIPSKI